MTIQNLHLSFDIKVIIIELIMASGYIVALGCKQTCASSLGQFPYTHVDISLSTWHEDSGCYIIYDHHPPSLSKAVWYSQITCEPNNIAPDDNVNTASLVQEVRQM